MSLNWSAYSFAVDVCAGRTLATIRKWL